MSRVLQATIHRLELGPTTSGSNFYFDVAQTFRHWCRPEGLRYAHLPTARKQSTVHLAKSSGRWSDAGAFAGAWPAAASAES